MKKLTGTRRITLPDGSTMSRNDLPAANTKRWVASRKAAVVRAVDGGLIAQNEALETYGLSQEEFDSWHRAVHIFGEKALKTTRLQDYRQPEEI